MSKIPQNTLFGEPVYKYVEEKYDNVKINPFDFINAIHHSKENLSVDLS